MVSDSRTDYLGDDVNECAPRSIDRVIEILVELYDLKLRYELHHEYLIQRTMHVTYDQMQQPMIVSIDAILIIKIYNTINIYLMLNRKSFYFSLVQLTWSRIYQIGWEGRV